MSLLASAASETEFAPRTGDLLGSYFSAWNESDPSKRHSFLEACWEVDGTYLDRMANVSGRVELESHIATARMMAPTMVLKLAGDPNFCQGYLKFDWEVTSGTNDVMFSGTSFARVTLGHRISQLVSFFK